MGRSSSLVFSTFLAVVACGRVESRPDAASDVDALSVVATALAGVKIQVTWTTPATGGLPVTSYLVTGSPGNLSAMATTTSTTFSTGLEVGTQYTFTVTPQTAMGAAQSATSNAVTAGNVPGAPSGVTAMVISPGTVRVSWSAPPANAYPITGYTVTTTPASVTSTTTSLTATLGPLPGGTYTFDVVAANALGTSAAGRSSSIAACTPMTRTFTGADKVDVNYGSMANTYTDNMARAYSGGPSSGFDITGWFKFNTTGVPAAAQVTMMQLSAYAVPDFSSPYQSPNVAISYTTNHTWTRSTATQANMPRTAQVTGGFGVPTVSAFNTYTIAPGARDWSSDFQAGVLTLGVTNVNPNYSYAYFRGTDTTEKPTLTIVTCE
jgi:hypothetical protein